jgi:hypothetical protein
VRGVRVRVFGWYMRRGTKTAGASTYRLLEDWCDYRPAHYRVKWIAYVDGLVWGQSCHKHVGALAIDAMREGNSCIRPARLGGRRDGVVRVD